MNRLSANSVQNCSKLEYALSGSLFIAVAAFFMFMRVLVKAKSFCFTQKTMITTFHRPGMIVQTSIEVIADSKEKFVEIKSRKYVYFVDSLDNGCSS